MLSNKCKSNKYKSGFSILYTERGTLTSKHSLILFCTKEAKSTRLTKTDNAVSQYAYYKCPESKGGVTVGLCNKY
jgi:hypothetical protein